MPWKIKKDFPTFEDHINVTQSQFIDSEIEIIRDNFIKRHSGLPYTSMRRLYGTNGLEKYGNEHIEDEARLMIIQKACEVLRQHNRIPKYNLLWFIEKETK